MLSKMGDIIMAESPTMLFSKEFENLHDDGFEGSMDEHRIFTEVFFGSGNSSNKGFALTTTTNNDSDYIKQTDMSLCSNCGNSSLTSQDDYVKEDCMGRHLVEYLSGDFTSSIKSNHNAKLSVGDLPDVKLDLGNVLIMAASSEGAVSGFSQQKCDYLCPTLTYRLVESSGHGVTSSCHQLKQHVDLNEGCKISAAMCSRNRLSTLDHNDTKEAPSRAVTSPISEESYASKLLVIDQSVSVANKSRTHKPSKPKWKDSCFLKLEEEEFAMPSNIKNDPRPLLRFHINRLLRAAGWVIGRRKRNSKYNGIGEYVYKSPGGRPFREFHKAWCMCGESLLADAISFMQKSDCMQWTDMTDLWTGLSLTVKEIEEKLTLLETTSAMVHLWCLLDPFVNVVFIDKTIRLLKEGITVKARRSLLLSSDAGPAAKYRKISKLERSGLSPRPLQACRDDTSNQLGVHLFDVPISSENAPKLLGGPEAVYPPLEDSIISSPSFSLVKSEEEGRFGCIKKAYKKSRKISEMKLAANHSGERAHYPEGEMNSAKYRSKKSKACGLHDDDLLISAIIKTKTFKSTKKWSSGKPKPLRKRKTPKGSCRLLPRNLNKGAKAVMEGKWCSTGPRTVISWLIHSAVVSLNEVIQYRNLKNDAVIKDGLISRDGIICKCCNKFLSVSEFKGHAGFRSNRPCVNLFMESGKPLTLCYLEAWSAEYKARKRAPQTGQIDDMDQNDDSCGHCGDVGELICCDNCPSAFHQACLFEQELPEGSWYCPQCRCQICGDAVGDKETSQSHEDLKCSQCEHRYHGTCMAGKSMEMGLTSDTWFCGESCEKVYSGLQSRIGLMNLLSDGFSWTLLRCIPGDQRVHSAQRAVALRAECNSKLAVAITILEECFLPMVDMKTGIDMIPQVMYNWGSQFARLNYNGFYTVVLERDDVILSVASIRIHGVTVAELPLVATCNKNRRQGMCRRLINSIEEMLKSLKVEMLVVSAIPTLVETWTVGFGFQPLEEDERRNLSKINLMVFPGAVWLKKPLYENHASKENSGYDAATLYLTEVGTDEGELLTEERGQFSDNNLSAHEAYMKTRICIGGQENLQPSKRQDCRILQNQPSTSFDEQDPRPSDCNLSVEGTNVVTGTKIGELENVLSPEEIEPEIFLNQPSKLDEPECGQLSDYNLSVEEANIETKIPYSDSENLRSKEQHFGVFHNEFSEHSSDLQDSGILRIPVSNVSSDELVSLSPGSQVEVICYAEEMHTEGQKIFCKCGEQCITRE